MADQARPYLRYEKGIIKFCSALDLNALDASPDDILQAMIDYQDLVDSIDDEIMKVCI